MHERWLEFLEQPSQCPPVGGHPQQLPQSDEPPESSILDVPRVRECGHRRAVNGGAGGLEEVRGTPARNHYVHIPVAECADEERQALRGATRLWAVMNEEDA